MDNKKIKSLLVANGIKQTDIAKRIGVKRCTVSLVLNNHSESKRVKQAIADALGKNVELLWPH